MRFARGIRVLLLAMVLGPALLAVPSTMPPAVNGVGPLPPCRLDDVLTEPRGYEDWATTLVDWNLAVGRNYKPTDLVSIFNAGVTGGGLIRDVAFDDLKAMATAARRAGVPLGNVSAYRSFPQQVKLFAGYVKSYGFDDAITFSARAGHSEHQLGLVIDFAAAGTSTFVNEKTPTGAWLAKNGWKYGWLMSYPDGKDELVCYHYEPWHYRYVGRDLAEKIHESGLTIREYLWANYTQLDAECVAAPEPTIDPLAKPNRRSCSLAEPSPSAPASGPGTSDQPSSSDGSMAPPGASAPAGASAQPGSSPAPSPTGTFDQALPIGILLVVAVAGMLGFILWRNARRSARYR